MCLKKATGILEEGVVVPGEALRRLIETKNCMARDSSDTT